MGFLALFPGKNAKMFQQDNAGVLKRTSVRMYLGKFALIHQKKAVEVFPDRSVAVFQKLDVREFLGEYRDRNVRMFQLSNAPTHLGKNVHQAQDKNVRKSQDNSAQQHRGKNAGMFHLSSVKSYQDR